MKRALGLIDGEHYAPVIRDAFAELPYEFVAAHLVGGTEKLRGGEDYGVPLVADLEEGLEEHEPDVVVDLSDEPVLGPADRFRLASRVLAHGLPYVGADFRFDPPAFEPFELPSLGIVGTGKRVGKTALAGHASRLLGRRREVVVVAMGRGGPPEPEVAEAAPSIGELLELSRAGRHAASDYLEDAALARVVTVGCRRCGGGLAGTPFVTNVGAGAAIAARRSPDLVIFEGSGAALPPIETRKRVLVVGGDQPPELVTGYLNAFRILVSDLVVVTGASAPVSGAIRSIKELPVVAVELRPRPAQRVAGLRVAFFTTAPPWVAETLGDHLRERHDADVVSVSTALARRDELRHDLEHVDAEVYLVELKAAAVDVVAETAAARGAGVVLCDNELLPVPGGGDLDAELEELADAAAREVVAT